MISNFEKYFNTFKEKIKASEAFFSKLYTEEILLIFLMLFVFTIILVSGVGSVFSGVFGLGIILLQLIYLAVTLFIGRKNIISHSVMVRRPETVVLAAVAALLFIFIYPYFRIDIVFLFFLFYLGTFLEVAVLYDQKKDLTERFILGKEPKYPSVREDTRKILEEMDNSEVRLENEVNERMKAERLRSELITNISHDIRTPLTSIINFTKLLSSEDTTSVGKDYLSVIDKSAQRMKIMVEDLFEASKSATGNIEVNMTDLDFSEVLMQVYAPIHNSYAEKNIELVYNRVDKSVIVKADGKHLMRVVQNLLVNARKYSVENTRVYIKVKELKDTIEVSIINVSRDKLDISPDELMEQFVRADKSRTEEGPGLGLYIAHNLMERMGGELILSIEGDVFTSKIVLKKGIQDILQ